MRPTTIRVLAVGLLASLAVSLSGCPRLGGTGTVRVLVTDKPYPYDFIASATLTITRVDVRTGDPSEEDEDAFITIFEGSREFDLTDLQNGRTDLLADATIPQGTYTQMRLFVTEGAVTLTTDPNEIALTVPSGASSGIKLNYTFNVETDEQTVLLLDVDMSRAFRPVPSGEIEDPNTIREFQFAPSLAMRLIDVLEAGSIGGTVTDTNGEPIEDASITAFDEDENEVTSTSAEEDGTYVLSGLHTGTYRVEVSATGFLDSEETGVEVTAGEQTSGVDISLQPK